MPSHCLIGLLAAENRGSKSVNSFAGHLVQCNLLILANLSTFKYKWRPMAGIKTEFFGVIFFLRPKFEF